jgi:DNA modification methylase
MKVVEKLQLGKLVTSLPNRKLPVYNWFYFKESFSRDLVFMLVETLGLNEGDLVLDPFVGCGTLPLACKQLGIDSIGYDIHPIMLFVSRVKLRDYDVEKLRTAIRELVKSKFEKLKVEMPSFISGVFPKHVLEDLVFFKKRILEIEDETIREFLLLGLINTAMRCSYAFKDGAVVKIRERRIPSFRRELYRRLSRMCRDLESFETKPCNTVVEQCDARKLKLGEESVDAIITSPPYLGKHEYIHAYRIEQELLDLEGPDPDQPIGSKSRGEGEKYLSGIEELVRDVPIEARSYFGDMFRAIEEFHRVCKEGAKIVLITSDGCFPKRVVETGCVLNKIAELVGFKVKRTIIVNKRLCTTPSRKKIGVSRESLLIWEK